MGLAARYYLFPEAGEPFRLAKDLVERLGKGEDFLPQYANTRQRVLEVILENVDGKADHIVSARGTIWAFDHAGGIAESLRKSLVAAMDTWWEMKAPAGAKVVDLQPKLKRKRYEEEHQWPVGEAELDVVSKDIFSKGSAGRLQSLKGSVPKPPPLTRDAKRALVELGEPFFQIQRIVEGMDESALAGFAFEARRLSTGYDYPTLHSAVAEMVETHAEILRRHKKGDGVWYAFVDILRWDSSAGRHSAETLETYHVRCSGKKAAVVAARKLLAEHASRFADNITVEASIETDMEWDAAGRASIEVE